MHRVSLVPCVILVSLLTGCSSAAMVSTSTDDFDRLAAQVENEIRLAEKADVLWRDTESLLQDARAAHRAGRIEEAKRLANAALKQAQLAQQQNRANANAGPVYPRP